MSQQRIAVLFDNLGPYHIARLEALRRYCGALLVIEKYGTSREYPWQPATRVRFDRVTLAEVGAKEMTGKPRTKMETALAKFQPSAIAVPGWSSWLAFSAIRWAHANSCPAIVMSDSQVGDFKRVSWKEAIKRRVLKFTQGALVGGAPHQDYLRQLGVPPGTIFTGYDVVDNDYFEAHAGMARSESVYWRHALGLPELYFLSSARFIPKKNLLRLLRAFALYLDRVAAQGLEDTVCDLVLLGDGPLRAELEVAILSLGLAGKVHLPGFRQIDELPTFYALAEAFIHPSTTEQWGLVVNEAMACGLPVLVSDRCGCAPDLIENGMNGYTFDPYDASALADLMVKIGADDCNRAAMGRASWQIIRRWSPETFAAGLNRAIEAALAAPPRKVGILDRALLAALVRR